MMWAKTTSMCLVSCISIARQEMKDLNIKEKHIKDLTA